MVTRNPFIFFSAHGGLIGSCFVFVPNEVQMSMDDDTEQLIEKQLIMCFCVVLHAVNGNH